MILKMNVVYKLKKGTFPLYIHIGIVKKKLYSTVVYSFVK